MASSYCGENLKHTCIMYIIFFNLLFPSTSLQAVQIRRLLVASKRILASTQFAYTTCFPLNFPPNALFAHILLVCAHNPDLQLFPSPLPSLGCGRTWIPATTWTSSNFRHLGHRSPGRHLDTRTREPLLLYGSLKIRTMFTAPSNTVQAFFSDASIIVHEHY